MEINDFDQIEQMPLERELKQLRQRIAELESENYLLKNPLPKPQEITNFQREFNRLKQVITHSTAAIAILRGPDLMVELANPAYQQVVGRSKSIEGMPLMQALPELEGQGFKELMNEVYQSGKPFYTKEMAARLDRNQDGQIEDFFFSFMYYPLLSVEGGVEGIFIHAADITEQVRTRQALEQERQRLKEVFINAPAAIATLRMPDYVFELTNAPYMRLVGRQNSIIGLSVLEALPEVAGQGFIELLDQVCQTGVPFIGQEMSIQLDPNGDGKLEQAFLNFVYQPLFALDGSGKVEGIFAHVIDVTEQVQARKQIEELSRLKDEFLAIASHDLRTPVTSIKGYLQLLQRNLRKQLLQQTNYTKEGLTRFLDTTLQSISTVLNQTNRLNELLNRLLDFSQITQSQLSLRRTPNADLVKLVQEVVTNLSVTTQDHQIVMQPPPSESINLSYDEARIEQVLNNLVGNAIKYSPANTTITIGIELPQTEQKEVVVWVQDQGYGINPAQYKNLFERFYRVRNEQIQRKGGLGLGLYISSQIVKQHEGRLWVESTEGQGSTFYLALPLQS